VLDTNVALAWLLFGDPAVAPLAAAVGERRVRWLATEAMRDELSHVLSRGLAARRGADGAALVSAWSEHVEAVEPAPRHRLTCSDADDQKFLDLAFAAGARWLVTRDRALLRLARSAATQGLAVLTPERWTTAG
jgi:putative PIN family toxin of toxin-antitoxin system